MTTEERRHKSLEFGGFTLDAEREALSRDGADIRLRPQSYDVLRYLAENPNRLVTKDEIFASVWGRTVVTDDSLAQCLMDIRRALGDGTHEIIRTVPRRGYVFEMPVREIPAGDDAPAVVVAQGESPPGTSATRRGWIAAAAAAAIAAAGLAWWAVTRSATDTAQAVTGNPANSIAVLAFSDLSEEGDQQYFADGVAEEILNLLARIPELKVVARTSSFAFRDTNADVTTIGRALNVAYLLEGSLRQSAERVRVTAQLVDARTGAHVWSEVYEQELGEQFNVQTMIAEKVARSLEVTLTDNAFGAAGRPVDPAAFEHYQQGVYLHNRRSDGDLALAEARFREALAIDPDYAAAWAGLAGTQLVRIFEDGVDPDEGLANMRVSIDRALELDPTSPEVQLRAAHYYAHANDLRQAEKHRVRALALGTNSPLVHASQAGRHASIGDYESAVEKSRRAVSLDPLGAVSRMGLVWHLAQAGQYEEAYREYRRVSELSPEVALGSDLNEPLLLVLLGRHADALAMSGELPDGPLRDQVLALAYFGLGRDAEATLAVEQLKLRNDPGRALRLAEIHAQKGDVDQAFEWIDVARDELEASFRTPGGKGRGHVWVIESPLLRPLHGDPRWQALLRHAAEFRERSIQNP